MSRAVHPAPAVGAPADLPGSTPAPARVLVVEDDHDLRALVCLFLQHGGLAPMEAADCLQAQAVLETTDVEVVLLDHLLPGHTGGELLASCARLHGPRRPGVAVLTGDPDRALAAGLLSAGADAVLLKPFDPPHLLRVVGRLAGEATQRRLAGQSRR
ncbi:response regulator [Nocardioides bruguierae]|uniref:Response regulator n=1 Tax=Nocardioides bruguierae TaxID=2945102 RepID=A0A9X2IFY3_9ACTN|nr:response regulator [Nocardioides bruguierae]MCM0622311.1 response regulator [Nocardioides bruguierae]